MDAEYLALLVEGVLKEEGAQDDDEKKSSSTAVGGAEGGRDDLRDQALRKQVAELLGRVVSTSTTRGEPRIWEVYARFNEGAGR